jgi:hypothetical protein
MSVGNPVTLTRFANDREAASMWSISLLFEFVIHKAPVPAAIDPCPGRRKDGSGCPGY